MKLRVLAARARGAVARRKKSIAAAALAAIALPVVSVEVASRFVELPAELSAPHRGAVRVLDRDGHLLRVVRSDDGARAAWVDAREGKLVIDALVATEDKRFESHHGVDWIAVMRALALDLSQHKVVSGASTLTMQLARTVRPHPRTFVGKFREAALAVAIERRLTKQEIAEQYVNRVDFGPNLRGVGAASRAYFDKAPDELSLGEAALLASIVRGPTFYDLDRRPDAAVARRRVVLSRMRQAHMVDDAQLARAEAEPVVLQKRTTPFGAPHFVRAVTLGRIGTAPPPDAQSITTTLDPQLQRVAELTVARVVRDLETKHVTAAAVIAVENETGDVLAYVGSPDFHDDRRGGQNDGVFARRQPGSTLKPFVYELAMERLGMTPATLLPDVEVHFASPAGDFSPRDYDQAFRGPVRLREVLGNSLNVPAVVVANRLGVGVLLERLRALGFGLDQPAEFYGEALALGDGEVSLFELARAYSTLARGGEARPLRSVLVGDRPIDAVNAAGASPTQLLDRVQAARITDVLSDPRARLSAFGEDSALDQPFEAAGKTGTSKGYRDNWAVGYTREVTVAVWAGNFDGSAMDQVSGVTGAGPILHEVLAAAMRGRHATPLHDAPREAGLERISVCPLSGARPTEACKLHVFEWFTHDEALELPSCELHERVSVDPRNGLRAGPGCPGAIERVFERFPPEFAAWAASANRPLAPSAFSPACPDHRPSRESSPVALAILSPPSGARFVIAADRPKAVQALPVRIAAPPSAREVELRVDGVTVDRGPVGSELRWAIAIGDHVLTARAGGVESPKVLVHVRE